jgi:UDP-glucose 4-epimerase
LERQLRKIVVTGGAGFIGSHVTTALVKRGDQVVVIDNLVTGFESNLYEVRDDIDFVKADVCDMEVLAKSFRNADCVIHMAALASVPLSIAEPLRVNEACVTGTLNVLMAAQRCRVRRVIYAGSSSCYGDRPLSANRESDLPMTLSPYAVAKLAGEYYCQAFYQSFGLETVCLRYFNVFGPRQDPNSQYSAVIPIFISRMLQRQRPIIFGSGRQTRDFTHVDNVVHANLLALDAPNISGNCYNIADGRQLSILDLVEQLNRQLDLDVKPEFHAPRPGDILHSMADITLASRDLGYEPQVSFEDGLRTSIDYYRQSNSELGSISR